MQKRIVVLGGVGFIGTHLCLRLLDEGHEVFCVDIRDAVNSPLLRGVLQHPLFRYVHHNIINGFSIRCDEIYNLASPSRVRYNKALPVETLRVSVLGAINALDTARTEHAPGGLRLGGKHLRHRAARPGERTGQLLLDALHPLRRQARRRGTAQGIPQRIRRRHAHCPHIQHLRQRAPTRWISAW